MFLNDGERKAKMALELFMIGLSPLDMDKSLEFYRRLGVAVPDETAGQPHIGIKMDGELTFFLNTTKLVAEADRPRLILEFYLKERPLVDTKYGEMTGLATRAIVRPLRLRRACTLR